MGRCALILFVSTCLLVGCATPIRDVDQRAAPSSRGVRAADAGAADAIARLRQRLALRGFPPDVTGGPMVAVWSDEAPQGRLGGESAVPATVRRAASSGAWMVVTEAGGWWVWEADDAGPIATTELALAW